MAMRDDIVHRVLDENASACSQTVLPRPVSDRGNPLSKMCLAELRQFIPWMMKHELEYGLYEGKERRWDLVCASVGVVDGDY